MDSISFHAIISDAVMIVSERLCLLALSEISNELVFSCLLSLQHFTSANKMRRVVRRGIVRGWPAASAAQVCIPVSHIVAGFCVIDLRLGHSAWCCWRIPASILSSDRKCYRAPSLPFHSSLAQDVIRGLQRKPRKFSCLHKRPQRVLVVNNFRLQLRGRNRVRWASIHLQALCTSDSRPLRPPRHRRAIFTVRVSPPCSKVLKRSLTGTARVHDVSLRTVVHRK